MTLGTDDTNDPAASDGTALATGHETTGGSGGPAETPTPPRRRRAASRAAGPPAVETSGADPAPAGDMAQAGTDDAVAPSTTGEGTTGEGTTGEGTTGEGTTGELTVPPRRRATRKRARATTEPATDDVEVAPTTPSDIAAAAVDAGIQAPPPSAALPTGDEAAPAALGADHASTPAPRKRATRKRATKKAAAPVENALPAVADEPPGVVAAAGDVDHGSPSAAVTPDDATPDDATPADAALDDVTAGNAAPGDAAPDDATPGDATPDDLGGDDAAGQDSGPPAVVGPPAGIAVLFQPPDLDAPRRRRRAASRPAGPPAVPTIDLAALESALPQASVPVDDPELAPADDRAVDAELDPGSATPDTLDTDDDGDDKPRRRRRGGRGRRRRGSEAGDQEDASGEPTTEVAAAPSPVGSDSGPRDDVDGDVETNAGSASVTTEVEDAADDPEDGTEEGEDGSGTRRRRRRRRRGGADSEASAVPDDPPNTVVRVRQPRKVQDEVTGVKGSTRLEAKRQRRRDGRDSGRRRPVITESEFLSRREAVERTMLVREHAGRTQVVVLEDGVLVEHFVARKAAASTLGNVYLGKVQNVLPSMEAAFVDIGKGRNAVLYAGEVNWDAAGMQGQPRRIELALKSGDPVLVQVSKDPVGTKGARLTSQISLPGRYLVYVPNSSMTGISRKLPDTERARLKRILKDVVPSDGGVIVRTASEGASEAELERDVNRLVAQWEDIQQRAKGASAPAVLHSEPDLTLKVVRDVFNEDFSSLVVAGDEVWSTVSEYVESVAPDLAPRLRRWDGDGDVFVAHRVDEQIAKGLERKVWLPSGGSLVIDRTEAMTVVDVNTGKFVGSGGNLEETVTRNNLEAAEEIVRQLRLRDVGGIIVVDFIDMVLEANRDLVLRRLLECLGRDRTKHQVAEVTSLGLVQMTRKRVGQGLLEAFSEPCEACQGSGVVLHDEPVERSGGGEQRSTPAPEPRRGPSEASKVAEAARKAKDKAESARREQEAAAAAVAAAGDGQSSQTAVGAGVDLAGTADAQSAPVAVPQRVEEVRGHGDVLTPPVTAEPTAAGPTGSEPAGSEPAGWEPSGSESGSGPAAGMAAALPPGPSAGSAPEPAPAAQDAAQPAPDPQPDVPAHLEPPAAAAPVKRQRRRATSPVTAPPSATARGPVPADPEPAAVSAGEAEAST